MKKILEISVILGLYLILSSFSLTNSNVKSAFEPNGTSSVNVTAIDEIVVTYEKSDVCGLKYVGEVTTTEKRWFYHNNDLKEKTLTELKQQSSEKGGDIVFIDIKEKKGFGIFFSTTVNGYVYERVK